MCRLLLVVLAIAVLVPGNVQGVPSTATARGSFAQRAVLLSETTYPIVSLGDRDVPDLATWQFDNTAYGACVIGVWLLYDLVNYNAGSTTAATELVYGQQFCGDLGSEISGRVSSLRPIGPRLDYTAPSLTLYAEWNFQGAQEYIEADRPSFTEVVNASGLAITGRFDISDAWTLYDLPNYESPLLCLAPPESDDFFPGLVPDLWFLEIERIGSVRKGCQSGVKMVTAPVMKPGHLPNSYHRKRDSSD